MVMDDQCQLHRDANHTIRECEQLKHALGAPPKPMKTKGGNNDDQNSSRRYDNRNRRPNLHDYHDRQPCRLNNDKDRRDYHRDDRRDDRCDDYCREDRHEDNRNIRRDDRRDDRHDKRYDNRHDDHHRLDDHNDNNRNTANRDIN
jgi:chromodomain-helicase-DNA-binding protein 1